MDSLRTSRLGLRPLVVGDKGFVASLYQDREVVAGWQSVPYFGDRLEDLFHRMYTDWHVDGFAQFVIAARPSDTSLGIIGVRPGHEPGQGELGYVLAKAAWGRGIATEASIAVLDWAFSSLPITSVIAEGLSNPASIRVIEKLSFTDTTAPGTDLRSYSIEKAAWLSREAESVPPSPNGELRL